MPDQTVRCRKVMRNPLLQRKQMVVDIVHPGAAVMKHADIKQALKSAFRVQDEKTIFLFQFKTAFGGGNSTGFALIYDNQAAAKKFEPKYRLYRQGLATPDASIPNRKKKKDDKGVKRKTWGTGRRARLHKEKKAANA